MNSREPGLWGRSPWVIAALALSCAAFVREAGAQPDLSTEHAKNAQEATLGLDYDDARAELAQGDADDPAIALEAARLALYEADCDQAVRLLARPDFASSPERGPGGRAPGAMSDRAQGLADIARGCARVTAAIVTEKDEARAIEVRFQDEHDRALFPLIADTVALARDALTKDLGVDWPKPTRIIVVRDLLSLSAMTGLPYKSAQTTGTVAVAKWGRVTLLSPRASHHGYQWRDTIAHELTHLAVTRATQDRAPLWLQEGVAKREEVRWREPGPFDDRPSPDAVASRGIELKIDLALDKLGPSIAMLPSADQAMVAFAEVTSFIRYYANVAGQDALPRLFKELRSGKEADKALLDASAADLHAWDGRWRRYLAERPREPLPALLGLGGQASDARELRERGRLAELLLARGHAQEGLAELDRLKGADALDDPSIRYLRGRALEMGGNGQSAWPMVSDPKAVPSSYGPWWALRGRLARERGDDGAADGAFFEAVAEDPLDVESACEAPPGAAGPGGQTGGENSAPKDPGGAALCAAARAAGEPPFDAD